MPLFPVTDSFRADDIRMRRRRAALFLAGIGVSAFLLFGRGATPDPGRHLHLHQDDRHQDDGFGARWAAEQGRLAAERGRLAAEAGRRAAEEGRRMARLGAAAAAAGAVVMDGGMLHRDFAVSGPITVDIPCADGLRLVAADDGGNTLTAMASSRDGQGAAALGALVQRGGDIRGDCGRDRDARITVSVPRGHALTILQDGDADIDGGRFTDPVTVRMGGSGNVKLDATGALNADMHGSGDVTVGEVDGPLTASVSSSGDFGIGRGRIDPLSATLGGSGDLNLGSADVGAATIRSDGSAGIAIRHVGGPLDVELDGSGDLAIGGIDAPSARVVQQGSGRISIRDGSIDRLDAVRNGEGTLSILAVVRNGTLSQSGEGTTEIPHGTLRLLPPGG